MRGVAPVSAQSFVYIVDFVFHGLPTWLKPLAQMVKHCRSEVRARAREDVRLAVSVDTLLRLHFGLPCARDLKQTLPIKESRCIELLRIRAGVTAGVTEGYEPNALKLRISRGLSPCSEREG